ncbi:MAG: hypothetical protein WBL67_04580 [Nitrososphaeraceae archaeon]
MAEKRSYKKTRIQALVLVAAVFIALMGTNILPSPANATLDVQARQKAAAVMNLIDQSLGYYANATGSAYIEREHLPTSSPTVNMTGTNMTSLANATAQPIVSQADYQIAQGLADKALVTFVKTAPLTASNNDPQTILSVLSGLVTFKTAVDNLAPYNIVEDVMASPIDRDMERAFQTPS